MYEWIDPFEEQAKAAYYKQQSMENFQAGRQSILNRLANEVDFHAILHETIYKLADKIAFDELRPRLMSPDYKRFQEVHSQYVASMMKWINPFVGAIAQQGELKIKSSQEDNIITTYSVAPFKVACTFGLRPLDL